LFASRLALLVAGGAFCATASAAPGIRVEPFGVGADGQPVEKVVLENQRGMRLAYIDRGATLVGVDVADRRGKRRNVLLSLPDLASYERSKRQYAGIIGRYAGRIGGARYTLDGKTVQLIPFRYSPAFTLHGGPNGYETRLRRRQDFADAESIGSIYRLHSPDGDQNFPGALDISVTYRLLRKRDEFQIEYGATTDAPTVVNLTNHAYFNLAGAATADLSTHRFQIDADRYAVTDANRVPTGVLAGVAGTPLDFRRPASIAERLRAPIAPLIGPSGYDHVLVFARGAGAYRKVAVIDDTASGRRMEVRTTEPSVVLYSAGGFDGKEIGSEGVGYRRHASFAFETQHLPDSPNHPAFPTTALYPGQRLHSLTSFRFSTVGRRDQGRDQERN
jgi:aldose 1-epimerase